MTDVEGGLDDPGDLQPEPGALALASAEDAWTRDDWERAAATVLRKSRRLRDDDPDDAVWATLTRRTLDGIDLSPLGTPDLLDGLMTTGRPVRSGAWEIRSEVSTNAEALADLAGGVTSLWVRAGSAPDWAELLRDVRLDVASVVLDGADPEGFVSWADGHELAAGTNLGHDARSATGEQARLAQRAGVLGFVVDGTEVHDQGASDVQELAHAMAVGVAALRALADDGVDVDEAAGLLEFRLAVTDEQFPSIAKLRAARRLWARVLELSGAEPRPMRQHAVTSRPMMSAFDPWVNMLRSTVAAFAAGVGGADVVTVVPFDAPLGVPDAFGRRIARNTSALLISESHVAQVTDPAGGSYAVEKLTDDLAVAAWDLFGQLDDGADLAPLVAATVAERDRQVATRERPITGLSEYPNLAEKLPVRDTTGATSDRHDVRRYGAAFEALRADPPAAHVFLATLGPVAAHTARAGFAINLLAAGGIDVDVAGATEGVDDLVAAYDGQRVVCLAGTDAAYAEWGEAAATALRTAGAARVVVAGVSTGSTRDLFEVADDSCALGVDAIDFLTRTREALS
jgi:methylmalonyl-CoA mutase